MLAAIDIARYFLSMVDEEAGDSISNLKLQKLVYYAQGLHLAIHGSPLFKEEIRAWLHGPVIPELYDNFKQHGSDPIHMDGEINYQIYSDEVREILDEVWEVYGQFSASKLRVMSHSEAPYKNTAMGGVITLELMREYFKSQLIEEPSQAR